MKIQPTSMMVHGDRGRLRQAWVSEAFSLIAYHRREIESCGGWAWIKNWLLSLILWWIDQDPKQAEVWMRRYVVIRDLQ